MIHCESDCDYLGVSVEEMDLESLTKQWQIGGMSNYDYLMALNL